MSSLLNHPVRIHDQWEMNTGDRVEGARMSCDRCECHTMITPDSSYAPRCSNCGAFEMRPVRASPADPLVDGKSRLPER